MLKVTKENGKYTLSYGLVEEDFLRPFSSSISHNLRVRMKAFATAEHFEGREFDSMSKILDTALREFLDKHFPVTDQ